MNQSNTTSSRFLGGKELYMNPTYIPWYIHSLSDGLSQGRQQICQTECSDNDYNLCWQWPYFGPNKVAPHKSSRPLLSIPFQLESTTNSPAICGYHWVHANCHRNMEISISLGLNPHLCWWSCLEIAEDSSCWCPTSLTIPHLSGRGHWKLHVESTAPVSHCTGKKKLQQMCIVVLCCFNVFNVSSCVNAYVGHKLGCAYSWPLPSIFHVGIFTGGNKWGSVHQWPCLNK